MGKSAKKLSAASGPVKPTKSTGSKSKSNADDSDYSSGDEITSTSASTPTSTSSASPSSSSSLPSWIRVTKDTVVRRAEIVGLSDKLSGFMDSLSPLIGSSIHESSSSSSSSSATVLPFTLILRPHSTPAADAAPRATTDPDATLFVANLPMHCSEKAIRRAFHQYGTIESVAFRSFYGQGDERGGGPAKPGTKASKHTVSLASLVIPVVDMPEYALIAFSSSAAVAKALQDKSILQFSDSDFTKGGLGEYINHLVSGYENPVELRSSVDEFMLAYDSQQKKVHQQAVENRKAMDSDGFVLVTAKRKRYEDIQDRRTVVAKPSTEKVLSDFYKFQQQQKKRDHLLALRSRFEQDKKRIIQMREQRKFRPY